MTLLNFFLRGGPLMFVLLALSIVGLSLVISKYRQILIVNKKHKNMADVLSKSNNLSETYTLYTMFSKDPTNSPLNEVICKAISLKDEDYLLVKESIEATANFAIHKLERGMGWISTISAIAPLVGFLGTVTGMVKVFIKIAETGQHGIDINVLAGGIWEALLTTVGGLIIGIPAIIFYNDLVSHAENNAKFLQEQIDSYMIKYRKFT